MTTFNKLPGNEHSTNNASTQEEVVLVNVQFSSCFQDLGTHVEGEQKLVSLKETSACIPTA